MPQIRIETWAKISSSDEYNGWYLKVQENSSNGEESDYILCMSQYLTTAVPGEFFDIWVEKSEDLFDDSWEIRWLSQEEVEKIEKQEQANLNKS